MEAIIKENKPLLGLNRKRFVEEILNVDFDGDERRCAVELGLTPAYFKAMIVDLKKKGGLKLLSNLYWYCKRTGRNPEKYIFGN